MLSTTSQYAIRALSCLATHEQEPVGGRDLAERTGVPASYLSKILLDLNRAGLVEATRGIGGGYRLARPPSEIFLMEVIDPLEKVSRLGDCIMGRPECSEESSCSVHDWWKRVRNDYLEMLQRTSLAQVIGGEGASSGSAAGDTT